MINIDKIISVTHYIVSSKWMNVIGEKKRLTYKWHMNKQKRFVPAMEIVLWISIFVNFDVKLRPHLEYYSDVFILWTFFSGFVGYTCCRCWYWLVVDCCCCCSSLSLSQKWHIWLSLNSCWKSLFLLNEMEISKLESHW